MVWEAWYYYILCKDSSMYIVVLALNEEMLSHEFSISFALYKVVGTKCFIH